MFVWPLLFVARLTFSAEADSYRPYEHPYPQIIQAFDYPTIEAIQTLGKSLNSFEISRAMLINEHVLKIGNNVELSWLKGSVQVGSSFFYEPETIQAFETLFEILNDNFSLGESFDVYTAHWRSSVYLSLTEIRFNVDCDNMIELIEHSNGPADPERHYVLNIERENIHYFFKNC